jgi:mRNA interferase MazF
MSVAPSLFRGDVVLVPFPFSDLSGSKVRPAVIISADPQDAELVLAFITSVLTNHSTRGAEVELLRSNPEFASTGLKTDSLLRLDKLVTLSRSAILRRLGSLGPTTRQHLRSALLRAF